MSFSPFNIQYERSRPQQLMDQHFGLELTPQDILTILGMHQSIYQRPWRNLQAANTLTGSTIKDEKDKFQINLDVQHFAPDEISVIAADGLLVVAAKHDERRDEHGFVSRSFTRKYPLPEGVQEDLLTSKLSSDGVLTVVAPLKAPPKSSHERIVPIIQTGPVKKTEGEE